MSANSQELCPTPGYSVLRGLLPPCRSAPLHRALERRRRWNSQQRDHRSGPHSGPSAERPHSRGTSTGARTTPRAAYRRCCRLPSASDNASFPADRFSKVVNPRPTLRRFRCPAYEDGRGGLLCLHERLEDPPVPGRKRAGGNRAEMREDVAARIHRVVSRVQSSRADLRARHIVCDWRR